MARYFTPKRCCERGYELLRAADRLRQLNQKEGNGFYGSGARIRAAEKMEDEAADYFVLMQQRKTV